MERQNKFRLFLVSFCIISLSSCTNVEALITLDAKEIIRIGNKCEGLYKNHIDAWNSRDPDNLRLIYTNDIVHFDGRPLFVGIEKVVDMARDMYVYFPDWQMNLGETYISKDICMGTWVNWGVFGFTEDDPGMEYDTLETQDGKISYWRAYYSQNFHEAIDGKDLVNDDFLRQFASAWTSRSADQLVNIYAQDASLEDTLFGFSVIGRQAIKEYASSFFAKTRDASWTLLYPFAESEVTPSFTEQYPFASQGGVFSIIMNEFEGAPCEIRIAVILTPNEEGEIQTQKTFYDANTLLACGWAE